MKGKVVRAMPSRKKPNPDIVRGGSITRAPNGKLYTILTTAPAYPSPRGMQELWSNARRQRYTPAWDGREPNGALVIYWTDPLKIACGKCRRSFGTFAAYHARDQYGIVLNTTHRYYEPENFPSGHPSGDPLDRRAPARPKFRLDGEIVHRAQKTTGVFWCRACNKEYTRNLQRLGAQVFADPQNPFPIS